MLSAEDLERLFERFAHAIDDVGIERESMFLTNLAFLLANRVGDESAVREAIDQALDSLPALGDPSSSNQGNCR